MWRNSIWGTPLTGAGTTIGALSGTGTGTGSGSVVLGTKALTAGTAASSSFAGVVSGTGSLVKQGAGTLTLTGTDTYSGATTVSGGKLLVNGSIASSSLVTVHTGATLGGSVTTGAVHVDSGGTLAAGNSPGLLHTGDLALVAGAIPGDPGEVYRLYETALHRAPERAGLDYYAGLLAQGVPAPVVAGSFLGSSEFLGLYGTTGDTAFITQLYANAFGRVPDTGGLAYQLAMLANHPGLEGRELVLLGVSQSPEAQVKLVGTLLLDGTPIAG